MKQRLYRFLVNRHPGIRDRYEAKRREGSTRWQSLLYLLWLNFQYTVCCLGQRSQFSQEEAVTLLSEGSESGLSVREPPEDLARKLMAFDVVSFDVFDTLIFRRFSHPADVFYLVGMELDYPDFRRLRIEAEAGARQKKQRETGCGEVTFEEIWRELEQRSGIPMERGMEVEARWEERCCYANPYMKQVTEILRAQGKRMVIASDMYLGEQRLRKLLAHSGYGPFEAYFVSADEGGSKADGRLYARIRQWLGKDRTCAHIGDHKLSDVRQAVQGGFTGMWYPNVQQAGEPYRPRDMSALTGSLYRGLVNAHIHNGQAVYSKAYEYGFIYGGLFVAGYCRFIHRLAQERAVDKLLFLSRDGAVLLQAYRLLYPGETDRTVYAYWSRLAAVKLSAFYYKAEYFRRFIDHKAGQGFTLEEILGGMELPDLVQEMCLEIKAHPKDQLTNKNREDVKSYLQRHWKEVLRHYAGQSAAGRQYYSALLEGCRQAVAVDIGWAGSGGIMLDYMVNQVWKLDCRITGVVAGTNSRRSPEPDAAEPQLFSGRIVSYLYSQSRNRDIWGLHDPASGHNLYWELLLGAAEGSFQGFYPDGEGGYECRFRRLTQNPDGIREIHRGILDFVRLFQETENRLGLEIPVSGRDAYAPMIGVCHPKNKKFMADLEDMMDEEHIT